MYQIYSCFPLQGHKLNVLEARALLKKKKYSLRNLKSTIKTIKILMN